MKSILFALTTVFIFTGCVAEKQVNPADRPIPADLSQIFTDGSPSPISQRVAWEIGMHEVKLRRQPDAPDPRFMTGKATRTNEGGWRVIAKAMTVKQPNVLRMKGVQRSKDAAVITIDKTGKVLTFSRYTTDELDLARRRMYAGEGG